ncbi:hypothetical protein ACFVXC_05480 [Streptomyces sp. NPDC058257]|uniref:hypothetical protein n=1 Tax=Streptomyces sp. NPDC058257 TaxID=3346409 RepID=UPI0036F0B78B
MAHIENDGRLIPQGGAFEPAPGYRLTYVGRQGLRHVFRDGEGEFARFGTTTPPRESRPVSLGERRTVVELLPDARPIVDASLYVVTHQMSVPGGWQDFVKVTSRAPQMLAGVYSGAGTAIEDEKLRADARKAWDASNPAVAAHPYTRLGELLLKVRLQEGTGEVGGWDDPAVCMEIAELLEKSRAL